jgi:hypothetical protein
MNAIRTWWVLVVSFPMIVSAQQLSPSKLTISDMQLEIFSDGYHEVVSGGLFYEEHGYGEGSASAKYYSSQNDRPHPGHFYAIGDLWADLVLYGSDDKVLIKLPVTIRTYSVGASGIVELVLNDDEWGFANVAALNGRPLKTILGKYKGPKAGLCPILGGSCFLAWGPEGLRLYNLAGGIGLHVDVSWMVTSISARSPDDPRWNTLIHVSE